MNLFSNHGRYLPFVLIMLITFTSPLAARHGYNPESGLPMHPDDPDRMHMGPGMHFDDPEHMKKDLGLSDEQIKAIGQINSEYHGRMMEIRKKIGPEREHLVDMLREEPVDTVEVKKVLQTIGLLQTEIRYQMILHRLDLEKVLTPEQRKKLREELRPIRRKRDFLND